MASKANRTQHMKTIPEFPEPGSLLFIRCRFMNHFEGQGDLIRFAAATSGQQTLGDPRRDRATKQSKAKTTKPRRHNFATVSSTFRQSLSRFLSFFFLCSYLIVVTEQFIYCKKKKKKLRILFRTLLAIKISACK